MMLSLKLSAIGPCMAALGKSTGGFIDQIKEVIDMIKRRRILAVVRMES